MTKEHKLERDFEGFIRIEEIKVSVADAKQIADAIFEKTGLLFEVKQLPVSFSEYDKSFGSIGKGSVKRKWTDDEDKYVLMNCLDMNNDDMGEKIGRSGMAVYMHKSDLQSDFDAWVRDHPIDRKLTREQQIDAYINDSYDEV